MNVVTQDKASAYLERQWSIAAKKGDHAALRELRAAFEAHALGDALFLSSLTDTQLAELEEAAGEHCEGLLFTSGRSVLLDRSSAAELAGEVGAEWRIEERTRLALESICDRDLTDAQEAFIARQVRKSAAGLAARLRRRR